MCLCVFLCRPLDFICSLSNRWSYGFAFGAIAPSVIQLFSESYTPFTVPNWAKGSLNITMHMPYDNKKKCFLSINQHIRIISEGSCDTVDNSALSSQE